MTTLFIKVFNLSITAGWIVIAALVLRPFLKKAPRWISVALWGIVVVRLVLPFSFQSVLSLLPSAQAIPSDILTAQTPAIDSGVPVINAVVNPLLAQSFSPNPINSVNPLQVATAVASVVWVAGMLVLGTYAVVSTLRCAEK